MGPYQLLQCTYRSLEEKIVVNVEKRALEFKIMVEIKVNKCEERQRENKREREKVFCG